MCSLDETVDIGFFVESRYFYAHHDLSGEERVSFEGYRDVYLDRFQADWNGGLKRMVRDGAWFSRAAYPYLATITCAGHATVSTGSFPHTHGVFQNAWWDRDARKQMTCTEDPNLKDVGYGVSVTGGDSAYRLQVPTFTDQMRSGRRAHVVSLSLKARSAIMLGGHGGDAVTWLTETLDGWETSAGYSDKGVPAVKAFVDLYLSDDGILSAVEQAGYVDLPTDPIDATRST